MNIDNNILYIEISNIVLEENILRISCNTAPQREMDIIHYDENFNLNWQSKGFLFIDLNISEGFITPTKKCLFINKNDFPLNGDLKDLSQYMVPDNLMLLKVEKNLIMKNIKSIIKDLIFYVS